MNLDEVFEKFTYEHSEFHRVENKLHARPDICAFLLLDKLVPNAGGKMVDAAEHDKFWLSVDCEELAKVATENDVLTLTRCGIFYDSDAERLAMFT